ncbi:glycosyltransferase family 39 protein [Patescibacteria group bacterium]
MRKTIKDIGLLIAMTLVPVILVWTPFFLRRSTFWNIPIPKSGMATIVANYDGPLYIVIAKTFYNLTNISTNFSFPLPNEYWAAHFPLYPLLIRFFSYLPGGFPYSMLLVTLFSSFLAIYFFYKLVGQYINRSNALWLTFVFSIFPARWLVVRSVGSPEPLFVAMIIASVYYFQNKKYLLAGVFGALAQLTKSPGILLFVAYTLSIGSTFIQNQISAKDVKFGKLTNWRAWPVLAFIPGALLLLFGVYSVQFGDFFAYFNSGDNIHLFFPPFQIFNYAASWVGTFWLEEVILVYLIGTLGVLKLVDLYKNADKSTKHLYEIPMWFAIVFFVSIIFVSHRDIVRYALPIIPFLMVGWSKFLTKKEFKIAFFVILIPIYLFTISFISQNVMPISDWAPLL